MTQAVATALPAQVDPRTRTQIVAAVLLGLFLAAIRPLSGPRYRGSSPTSTGTTFTRGHSPRIS